MIVAGLTGGIASGKSTVAGLLERRGAVLVDADVVAREVVDPGTPGLEQVRRQFGPGIVDRDGRLDRERLGAIVFADPERRAVLNAIVHPLVAQRTAQLITAAPRDAIVVNDVPLLVENRLQSRFDIVVVVDVPVDVQVDRLVRLRGLSVDDARRRIAAQATRDERLAVADVVIHNVGSRDDLERQVTSLWNRLDVMRHGR